MRLKNIVGITFLLIVLGCKSTDDIKIGTYERVGLSNIELGFRYIFQNVRGTLCAYKSLRLKADSSFELLIFPFISSGKWSYYNESLILQINESHWINDSLKSKYPLDKIPIVSLQQVVFRVNSENLIMLRTLGNNQKAIVKLKFKQPDIATGG